MNIKGLLFSNFIQYSNPHQIKPKITKQGMNNPAQNTALEKIQCIFTTKDFSLLIGIEF